MAVARAAAKAAAGKASTSSAPPASSSTATPAKTTSSSSSPAPAPAPRTRPAPGPAANAAAGVMAHPTTESAAGVILGALLWIWVGMPLIRGGPAQVRNVLRAKFFNKHADGSWLP